MRYKGNSVSILMRRRAMVSPRNGTSKVLAPESRLARSTLSRRVATRLADCLGFVIVRVTSEPESCDASIDVFQIEKRWRVAHIHRRPVTRDCDPLQLTRVAHSFEEELSQEALF